MSDESNEVVQDSAEGQAESVEAGESVEQNAPQGGESNVAESPLFDGMTAEALHKSYKEIQAEFTKATQSIKGLDSYGGIEQLAATAEALRNNPSFHEWVKAEQGKNAYGFNESEMSEDEKSALQTVEKISSQQVSNALDKLVAEKLEPLETQMKEKHLGEMFDAMDKKHPDWRALQDDMGTLAEKLAPEVYSNPTLKDVEMLYTIALADSDKFNDYAAKEYQRQLEEKKKNDTGKPTSHAGKSDPAKAGSMQEAYEQAKEKMGA